MKKNDFKEVMIGEQKYRVTRFTAETGSWIAFKVLMSALPAGIDASLPIPLPKGRDVMSKADFLDIQRECLRVCFSVTDDNLVNPLMTADGRYTDPEISHDMVLVIALTVHTLLFNIMPFFEEGQLAKLTGAFASLIPSDAPMSTSSPSDQ